MRGKIMSKGLSIVILAWIVIASFGCVSKGSQQKTSLFLLESLIEEGQYVEAGNNAKIQQLAIQDFRLPAYLNQPKIVWRSAENSLVFFEYGQWAGNIQEGMMNVLQKNFSVLLDSPSIYKAPTIPVNYSGLMLRLDVHAFEYQSESNAVVFELFWSVIDSTSSDENSNSENHVFRERIVSDELVDASPAMIARAMSQNLAELSRRVILKVGQ